MCLFSFSYLVLKILNCDLLSRKDAVRYVVLIAVVLIRTKMDESSMCSAHVSMDFDWFYKEKTTSILKVFRITLQRGNVECTGTIPRMLSWSLSGGTVHTRLVIKFKSRVPLSNFTRFVNEKSLVWSLSRIIDICFNLIKSIPLLASWVHAVTRFRVFVCSIGSIKGSIFRDCWNRSLSTWSFTNNMKKSLMVCSS